MKEYIIDGVPLRDPLRRWYIDYPQSETLSEVNRVHNVVNVYGFHGELESNAAYFGPSRDQITLNIDAHSKEEFNSIVSAFYALLSGQALNVVVAPQRTKLASMDRSNAQFVAGAPTKMAVMRLGSSIAREYVSERSCRLTFTLVNNFAFWRSTQLYTQTTTLGNETKTIQLNELMGDSNAPLTDLEVRVEGEMPATAAITLMDAADSSRSVSATTVATTASQSLVLKTSDLTLVRNSSLTGWTGTEVGSLRNGGVGQFFVDRSNVSSTFPSNAFTYAITLRASGFTTARPVTVRARRSYLS